MTLRMVEGGARAPEAAGPESTTRSGTAKAMLLERTELLALNAALRGDSDVLPWSPEFRVLRGYTKDLTEAAWASSAPTSTETVLVPLTRHGHRHVHLLDPVSFLRFGGSVLAVAHQIEAMRAPFSVSTQARWCPNRSKARLIAPGSFEAQERSLTEIARRFPFILHLDLAVFFPSIRLHDLHASLVRFGRAQADLVAKEMKRLGISGLPVGAVPARLASEALLCDFDRQVIAAGLVHTRGLDDIVVGLDRAEDAHKVVLLVSGLLPAPLQINKGKTKVIASGAATKTAPVEPTRVLRALLAQADPDRVELVRALYAVREIVPGWDARRRERWLRLLARRVSELPVCVRPTLRLIQALLPGTSGLDESVASIRRLFASPLAIHRAEAARFLSRQGADVTAELLHLALTDVSALARREALFGLVRLDRRSEAAAVLRGEPPTELDRGGWILAAGVFDLKPPFPVPGEPYQELLLRAAREHLPRDI